MLNREDIANIVRKKLVEKLNKSAEKEKVYDFVNEDVVNSIKDKKNIIKVTPNSIITPSARDVAEMSGIRFEIALPQDSLDEEELINPNSIALGSDHGGFNLKESVKKELTKLGYSVADVGTYSKDSVDYPDFAHKVASLVSSGKSKYGIIVDGAGIGSAIVANKLPNIRAAHCTNMFEVNNAKRHNNANILTLGERVIGIGVALNIVKAFLETDFEGGRHKKRVDKISTIENKYLKRL